MEQKIISKPYFIKRFTALCLSRLNELPQNNEARQVLLKALSLEFGSDQTYTEKQVNAVISDWLENTAHISGTDHVFLRRSLIDYGYFRPICQRRKLPAGKGSAAHFVCVCGRYRKPRSEDRAENRGGGSQSKKAVLLESSIKINISLTLTWCHALCLNCNCNYSMYFSKEPTCLKSVIFRG